MSWAHFGLLKPDASSTMAGPSLDTPWTIDTDTFVNCLSMSWSRPSSRNNGFQL